MKSFVILVLLGLGASQSDSPPPPPENLTTDIPTPPASDIPTVTQDIPTPPPIEDTETPAVPFTSEADLPGKYLLQSSIQRLIYRASRGNGLSTVNRK